MCFVFDMHCMIQISIQYVSLHSDGEAVPRLKQSPGQSGTAKWATAKFFCYGLSIMKLYF